MDTGWCWYRRQLLLVLKLAGVDVKPVFTESGWRCYSCEQNWLEVLLKLAGVDTEVRCVGAEMADVADFKLPILILNLVRVDSAVG